MAGIPSINDLKLGSLDSDKLRQMWFRFFSRLDKALPVNVTKGDGSPEGVVDGAKGDLYLNVGSGATLWVKESSSGTTGWVSK